MTWLLPTRFAITPPEKWEELRGAKPQCLAQRQHIAVPLAHRRMSAESVDDVPTRYAHVRNGLFELKRIIEEWKLDALIVIADDQIENFTPQNVSSRMRFFSTGFFEWNGPTAAKSRSRAYHSE